MHSLRNDELDMENVDIIVGIPSLNEADNIAFVAEQVARGLKKYYPSKRSLILNVDNESNDGTKEAFLGSETFDIQKKYISTGKDMVGKGNNMRNLFIEVDKLNAMVVIVVDADLKSISPEWVKTLATPVFGGHDYVTPVYSRNEYDGTITNHITYPLIYGLFKANIRQPIGGEFAFSPRMAKYWMDMKWEKETRQYGVDIFMTTAALLNGFKVCQVVLGSKVHKPSAPKLGPMFTQVINTLFANISNFKDTWMSGKSEKDCPVFGEAIFEDPQGLSIDYKSLKKESIKCFLKEEKLIADILSPDNFKALKDMCDAKTWNITPELWVKVLFDFILAYEKSENKKEIVEALKPIYFARASSFYRHTIDMTHKESEEEILSQAKVFENSREYLVKMFNQEISSDSPSLN